LGATRLADCWFLLRHTGDCRWGTSDHERVFTTAHSVFATGEIKVESGAIINTSLLTLPLADDGRNVNMSVSTLIVCFNLNVSAGKGWLRVKVRDVIDIDSAARPREALHRLGTMLRQSAASCKVDCPARAITCG
jgi:hypothetical protein